MPVLTKETAKSVRQLLVLAAIVILGYVCRDKFRFTVGMLNQIFVCVWLLVPFLAIRPMQRLPRWFRNVGFVFLIPGLLLASFLVLFELVAGGGRSERIEPLQAFQQGNSTIELSRYEYGGALGMRYIDLEQRRPIFPGLYLVKSVDSFEWANEVTLFLDAPYRVRVHVGVNFDDLRDEKTYALKPWVYF